MNSTKASSAERRYSANPFFTFTLNQNKHQFALYFIIVLLGMLLPCIISLGDVNYDSAYLDNTAKSIMQSIGVLGVVVSGLIGIFAGMGSVSYVNSKQATGCYHSLPVRREMLFLEETAVRAIYYMISIGGGYVLSYFMIIGSLPVGAQFTGMYLRYILCAVVLFVYVYSVMLVAAGLTGTAFMRFCMAGLITFLPLVLYMLVVYSFQMADSSILSEYYLDINTMKNSFSFLRVMYALSEVVNENSILRLLLVIPESAVYYGAALLLHKYRRSERATNTVVWKPLFVIIKYVLIVSAAILGMVFFGALFGENDIPSILFGTLFGLIASFMLVNSIMYRSPRLMFKGVKPFVVTSVIMILYMYFVPMNVTGMVGRAYPAWNTRSITFVINNSEVEITDRETIDKIVPLLRDADSGIYKAEIPEFIGVSYNLNSKEVVDAFSDYKNYELNKKYSEMEEAATGKEVAELYSYTSYMAEYVEVIQKPKIGITLAKSYHIDTNGELYDILYETEEFLDSYTFAEVYDEEYSLESIQVDFRLSNIYLANAKYQAGGADYFIYGDAIPLLLEGCALKSEYRENSPLIGTITVSMRSEKNGYETFNYPVYAADLAAVDLINTIVNTAKEDVNSVEIAKYQFTDIESYYTHIAESYMATAGNALAMVNVLTGEARFITTDRLAELAPYTATFGLYYDYSSVNEYVKVSDSPYIIIANRYVAGTGGFRLSEIRFREGAISDAELEAIFNGLEG